MSPAPPPPDVSRSSAAASQDVFWLREDHRVVYVSPSYETVWGQTCDSLYADPDSLFDAIHADDRAHVRAVLAAAQAQHETARVECRVGPGSDDATRWMVLQSVPTSMHHPGHVAIVAQDVTPRRRRERTLREAVRTAQQDRRDTERARQRMLTFLSNVSHELRTPLTSIIGFAEVLGAMDLGDATTFARLIERGGRRLFDTLNSVLTLSRLEADAAPAAPTSVDLIAEVRQTVDLFRESAHAASVELRVMARPTRLPAVLDPSMLHRVLSNLIDNALKFTPPGGSVTIRMDVGDDVATIVVSDTGVGIDPAFLPRLFDAFAQDDVHDTDPRGVGLGLAITKRLVDLMNGTIRVDSALDEGTTFTLRLPTTPSR